MSSDPVDVLTSKLSSTLMTGEGVSFAGKSLKLDNASDAQIVVDAIDGCRTLEFLDLEGNTLGVDAAKAIGTALSKHPELKRALWKDMFTGRLKNEIPQALRFLGSGLDVANVRLVELDLSDNAFGPIGMEGLASLLKSSPCYSLQVLRLNNNGLGITGAKLLSKALLDCYENSKESGKPLPLRVFIAGRNRLENEGIQALSRVFKVLGSLEEIQIPQNGIYYKGVGHLANALTSNTGLRVLNLNDNTVGPKGSESLAVALTKLQQLRSLNLGDCLVRTSGAITLAASLQPKHQLIEEIILDHNEIKKDGAFAILEAVKNKTKLTNLLLNGNQFGEEVVQEIKSELRSMNKENVLGSFSEDEEDDDEEEDEEGDEDEDGSEENEENGDLSHYDEETNNPHYDYEEEYAGEVGDFDSQLLDIMRTISAADFLKFPTPERFFALKNDFSDKILEEVKKGDADDYIERLVSAAMKVSSLAMHWAVSTYATSCADDVYSTLFEYAKPRDELPLVHNTILAHMGLIKAESKKTYPEYDREGCRMVLESAMKKAFFPQVSKDTINFFLKKK